ncbi:hypothetical protein BsWGS_05018 [Bradybaena similaris]
MAAEGCEANSLGPVSYTFVRVLGSGAFGEAVLYQKTEDNSLVVWKEINLARVSEKQRRDSQSEIDILSLLNHPNIISYYNHFIDENTLFIEMEYANGGTLQEKISASTELWLEKDVLWYMYQLTSALAYIHDFGIIHRDIKTLNIFLTKAGLVKLGDFGISRFLESKSQMAETLVGTPYYMSPEIMKGERYNYKSDIWALGCVLYEMLTLEKTFQATNPLKLAMQIVKTDHTDVGMCYSCAMHSLVDQMLRKKPEERPTAEEVLALPLLAESSLNMEQKVHELNSVTKRSRMSAASASSIVSVITSKMCEMYQWGGGKLTAQKLEMFTREKSPMQVAVGHSHFAAISLEKELYTWANLQGGVSMVGQLGHGDTASCKTPKLVEALLGVAVQQVACGEDFTLCVSDSGALYAFGSNYYGCLGCDIEDDEVLSPVRVDHFLDCPVQEVACGDAHVVVLTRTGDVYTWGSGEFGRLGSGSEDDLKTPHRVDLPGKQQVKHVCAGGDSTFLVCISGKLLACGSNQFNKLGFNSETSGLRKRKAKAFDIPYRQTFSTVKPLSRYHVVQVSAGKTHSGVIDSCGYLYMFGSNKFGQLGVGDFKPRPSVCRVGGVLAGQRVEKLGCGDQFTVVATNENHIYSWGNGESGRLGGEFTDQGSGPNGMCTAIPRPIFGSLHVVSCLSCCHWHTLIIAEKVLNQKTLKSRASTSKSSGESLDLVQENNRLQEAGVDADTSDFILQDIAEDVYSQDVFSLPYSQPVSADVFMESSVPAWLRQELNEAEVIPIPSSLQAIGDQNMPSQSPAPSSVTAETEFSPQISDTAAHLKLHLPSPEEEQTCPLVARVAQLEEENVKLKLIISEQAKVIDDLRLKLP